MRLLDFLIFSTLLLPAQTLLAQTLPAKPPATRPDDTFEPTPYDSIRQVFTYVKQMPALPGAPPGKSVIPAIMGKLQELLEPAARGDRWAYITFTVGPSGCVYGARIIKRAYAADDVSAAAAVLRAVARLPRFVPGRMSGWPVSVSFTVRVMVK